MKKGNLKDIPCARHGNMTVRILPSPARAAVTTMHIHLPAGQDHSSVVHKYTNELACVLAGTGSGIVGGRKLKFKPGDFLLIPAGTPHQFRAGRRALEVLTLFSPAIDENSPDIHYQR